MKLELILIFLTKPRELFVNLCRILYSYSEKFYNLAREADMFGHLFRYLNKVSKTKKKITMEEMK
jgi:hypothetical protein